MKIGIYAVRDNKVNGFMQPMFLLSEGVARRSFTDAINGDKNGLFYKYPGDFDLYSLGSFDDQTGELIAETPRNLCNGSALVVADHDMVAGRNGSGPLQVR